MKMQLAVLSHHLSMTRHSFFSRNTILMRVLMFLFVAVSFSNTGSWAQVPAAPTNLTATVLNNSQVKLTWRAPFGSITGYNIYRCLRPPTGVLTWTLYASISGASTTYYDNGVSSFGYYLYKVSAVTYYGEGPQSSQVLATIYEIPVRPANLTATSSAGKIVLTWYEAQYIGPPQNVTGYKIYRSNGPNGSNTETLLVTTTNQSITYTDTNVTPGIYYYKVSAYNSAGDTPLSNEVSATLYTAPSAPTNFTITTGIAQVALSWTAPPGPVSVYNIYRSNTSGTEQLFDTQPGTSTTYLDHNVSSNGTYFYRVSAVNGTAESPLTNELSATMAPLYITGFSPSSGVVGTVVTITGNWLSNASVVSFGGTTAPNIISNTDTQIVVTVPSRGTNVSWAGPITVTTPNGNGSSTSNFTVNVSPMPTITSVSPQLGSAGTVVTITGTGFTGASGVMFNSNTLAASSYTVDSDTQIHATAPTGVATGQITVTTQGGTAWSPYGFHLFSITGFTPVTGPFNTTVTLTGIGFTGATGVQFNGKAATGVTVPSDTSMTAVVAPGSTTGPITVIVPAGAGQSSSIFTVIQPPTVTSFTPTAGMVGATVTITGSSFQSGVTVSAVKFNRAVAL